MEPETNKPPSALFLRNNYSFQKIKDISRDIVNQRKIDVGDPNNEKQIRDIRKEVVAEPMKICFARLTNSAYPLQPRDIVTLRTLILTLSSFVTGDIKDGFGGRPDDAICDLLRKTVMVASGISGDALLEKLVAGSDGETLESVKALKNQISRVLPNKTGGEGLTLIDDLRIRSARAAAIARVKRRQKFCAASK
jgi:hypothetical protein